jgi:hypothetical protein
MKPANKMYIPIVLLGCLLSSLYLASCKKYIEVGAPKMSLMADKVFEDSTATLSSVLNLYKTEAVELLSVYPAMSADELIMPSTSIWGGIFNAPAVQENQLTAIIDGNLAGFSVAARLYSPLYQQINNANLCIAGISASTGYGEAYKDQLIGECKFWRAWCYFYLTNLYGRVPLNITADLNTNKTLLQPTVAELYKQIVDDLTDARNRLSVTNMSTEKSRVNKAAVTAMLARVYFYQQNWSNAYTEANSLITPGTYTLETDLANVFLKNSKETIFQLQTYGSTINITGITTLAGMLAPLSGVLLSSYCNANLLSSFQSGDLRKSKWTTTFTDFSSFQQYTYPSKYKNTNTAVSGNEYLVIFRLAEMYLIRAEAAAHTNKLADAEEDLFTVRKRAGLTTRLALPDLPTALNNLERERRFELFLELGDRWLNLKRKGETGTILKVTKASSVANYTWQDHQVLYPMPTQEIYANPNIKQNPDY